jgi:hypothetical protein
MQPDSIEREFVKRSLTILDQYQDIVFPGLPETENFEITLLINLLYGLIVLPFEHCRRVQGVKIPKLFDGDDISILMLGPEWSLSELHIEKFRLIGKRTPPFDATLRELIFIFRYCMYPDHYNKGSLDHFLVGITGFDQADNPNTSGSVKFEVNIANRFASGTEFVASLPFVGLRSFARMVAKSYLQSPKPDTEVLYEQLSRLSNEEN